MYVWHPMSSASIQRYNHSNRFDFCFLTVKSLPFRIPIWSWSVCALSRSASPPPRIPRSTKALRRYHSITSSASNESRNRPIEDSRRQPYFRTSISSVVWVAVKRDRDRSQLRVYTLGTARSRQWLPRVFFYSFTTLPADASRPPVSFPLQSSKRSSHCSKRCWKNSRIVNFANPPAQVARCGPRHG